MAYIGNIPVPQATQTRDRFTATSGQTSFPTSGYTPGFLDVYLNGVHLDASDYTATNGSDVVLITGATLDDILEVVAFTTFTPSSITLNSLTDVDTTGVADGEAIIYNSGTSSWEPGVAGGGATGGGSDQVFYENGQTVTTNYTLTANTNAMSVGQISIDDGVTVTIPDGSRWVVI